MEFLKDIDNIYKKIKTISFLTFVIVFFGGGMFLLDYLEYEGILWAFLLIPFFALFAG